MKRMTEVLMFIAAIYLLGCSALYFLQDKLIFFPPIPIKDVYQSVRQNEISFLVNNELRHGWKIKVDSVENKTILYFGGNSEDVVYLNTEAKEFKVRQIISINHPGYGKSTGKPSQESFYKNALDVYDRALNEYQLKPEEIIVIGRSLGSSVATYLAAHRKIAGLILITPFDSVENMAAKQYKLFPVRSLLKHAFPTVNYIKQVKFPILMLAAEEDEVIPDEHLKQLNQFADVDHKLIRYAGVGHNTIQTHNSYYNEINNFIDSL